MKPKKKAKTETTEDQDSGVGEDQTAAEEQPAAGEEQANGEADAAEETAEAPAPKKLNPVNNAKSKVLKKRNKAAEPQEPKKPTTRKEMVALRNEKKQKKKETLNFLKTLNKADGERPLKKQKVEEAAPTTPSQEYNSLSLLVFSIKLYRALGVKSVGFPYSIS